MAKAMSGYMSSWNLRNDAIIEPDATGQREGGGGAEGAGAAKTVLPFGELRVLFFGREKNDPGPSPSRTSRTNTNIQRFPFAMGQRGGQRARARRTRWVWNAGRKSTHAMWLLSSFCISKNQHFLFHLIQSYYILFLLFWG